MYEIFKNLCEQNGVTSADVSKATGVAKATLSEWKKGTYTPKTDKLQKIAEYFGVTIEYLMTGQHPEQTSDSGKKYYSTPRSFWMRTTTRSGRERRRADLTE